MLAAILAAVIPVLVSAGLGFFWVRSGRPFVNAMFTPLVVDIGTPCLIFATFAKTSIPPANFAAIALASVVAIGCFALVAAVVLPLAGLRLRTFLPSLSFPNNGNLGLPLAAYAFGEEGLGYAIVFYAICMIGQFHRGSRRSCRRLGELARSIRAAAAVDILRVLLGVGVSCLRDRGAAALVHWNTISLSLGGNDDPAHVADAGSLACPAASGDDQPVDHAVRVTHWRRRLYRPCHRGIVSTRYHRASRADHAMRHAGCRLQLSLRPEIGTTSRRRWASLVVVSTLVSTLTVPVLLKALMF